MNIMQTFMLYETNTILLLSEHKRSDMNELFKKLNYKGQRVIYLLQYPDSFRKNISSITGDAIVRTEISDDEEVDFVMFFSTKLEEVRSFATRIEKRLKDDAVVWLCYPKGTSKKFSCDFNRDTCWTPFEQIGMEGVRMVSIDEDWSALRFRRKEFVKR